MRGIFVFGLTALAAANAAHISTNAQCGTAAEGRTCKGSKFGDCCSQHNWCGSTSAYCGEGCNPLYGTCTSVASTLLTMTSSSIPSQASSAAAPSASVKVSRNARCGNIQGATGGFTCLGSRWGDCCSRWGYCGLTSDYCAAENKCQPGFGKCTGGASSSIRSLTSSVASFSTSISFTSSAIASSSASPSPSATFPSLSSDIASSFSSMLSASPSSSPSSSPSPSPEPTPTPPTPTPTPMPTPTPQPVYNNFCLKVLNPDVPTFNYFASVVTTGSALHVAPLGTAGLTRILFNLDANGNLVLSTPSPGFFVQRTSDGGLLRARAEKTLDDVACSITTNVAAYPGQPVAQCNTPGVPGTFNNFQVQFGSNFNFLSGTQLTTSTSSIIYLVDLGVFTGAQCF